MKTSHTLSEKEDPSPNLSPDYRGEEKYNATAQIMDRIHGGRSR